MPLENETDKPPHTAGARQKQAAPTLLGTRQLKEREDACNRPTEEGTLEDVEDVYHLGIPYRWMTPKISYLEVDSAHPGMSGSPCLWRCSGTYTFISH
jgi:hypothetical protein